MFDRITQDEQFKAAVKAVKDGLAAKVMSRQTDEEERNVALLKYHLVDDIVAALASAEQQ